jgi:WD40 repeat protein
MDSASTSDFSKAHVKFRAHHNAVMDIAFSSDDYSLATASGDQTARVTDMQTQQTMCILSGHKSSVKQVRFHPSDNNMVTTSARDGCVQLWDLRCGSKSAVQNFRASIKGRAGDGTEPETRFGRCLGVGYGHRSGRRPYGSDNRSELSITSFQHLLNGREHMIVTSSEVDASVKLWDLRNAGRRNPVPLASTPLPESHGNKRNFGINAMVLSGDGSRLYTVCRDAAVYAYSTNQLVLGHAPEMSSAPSRRRMLKQPMAGLGPLYAFKNPQLRLATFFVRASMRPAKGDKCEMLAVGSSNYGPILFPTDERHVPRPERPSQQENDPDEDGDEDMGLPSAAPVKTATKKTMQTGTQVFEHGTALVGAHDKEVTSLAWTMDGALVSVSDDFSARCWREEADQARSLRTAGDFGGGRWRSGWAAVDAAWDEDDC